jgi:hypothetical protein
MDLRQHREILGSRILLGDLLRRFFLEKPSLNDPRPAKKAQLVVDRLSPGSLHLQTLGCHLASSSCSCSTVVPGSELQQLKQ